VKPFRFLRRSIRDSIKSVIRNLSLSVAAIACTIITLILVAVSLIVTYNVRNVSRSLEKELTIVVYLKRGTTDTRIDFLETAFIQMDNVEEVTFKDADEWKLDMKEFSDSYRAALDYLDENPLLDAFIVKVKDVKDLRKTTEAIREYEDVESAEYGEGMAETVVSALNIIQKITVIIVIGLIFVTAFLISNTIKITIFSRKSEIEIMRLVGASNSAIKLPFIFEGFILGFIGSIVPVLATIYGYMVLYEHFNGFILTPLLTLIKPFNFVFKVSLFIIVLGCVIGMFGSYRAVRKHLKI
jgi:cell division transport system permease protein